MRTERQKDMTIPAVALRNFANASKNSVTENNLILEQNTQ
jgi:hypothetical protein